MIVPAPELLPPPGKAEAHVRALAAALGIPGSESDLAFLRSATGPATPTGHPIFDAEEDLFLERFAITNFEPSVGLGPVYLPEKASGRFNGAVRITNTSAFPISTTGHRPVVISYHWIKDGEVLPGEGLRSQLPVSITPGQSVTVHIDVVAPENPGQYQLRVSALQETVRWFDESSVTDHIEVTSTPPFPYPDNSSGEPFTETLDTDRASDFIDRHFDTRSTDIALEIGGGIRPSFRCSTSGASWRRCLINCDVSHRLLQVARLIASHHGHAGDIHIRADANTLPMVDCAVGSVFVSRALHHFADLNIILQEISRVLKPGGKLLLLSEPIGATYDDHHKELITRNVNEQIFPLGVYERCAARAGLHLEDAQNDWGFSFKGVFKKSISVNVTEIDFWRRYVPYWNENSPVPFKEIETFDYEMPAEGVRLRSMLSVLELSLIYALAKDYWSGKGAIVDLGCLYGITTYCFAHGLTANRSTAVKANRIFAYDLFLAEDYDFWKINSPTVHTGSLFPDFLRINRRYLDLAVACAGDLLKMRWGKEPVEILFIDAAKSWELNNAIVGRFFPRLFPGSVVVQQDYLSWHEYWTIITMEVYSDHFRQLYMLYGASAAYLCTKSISEEQAARNLAELSVTIKEQFAGSSDRQGPARPARADALRKSELPCRCRPT